jgi:hypothetical protein
LINIDTLKYSNSASIIEFEVELSIIAVTYLQLAKKSKSSGETLTTKAQQEN